MPNDRAQRFVRLFLCGDVMTGRGIDQIFPHPGNPRLYEEWVTSATTYVRLAEEASGPIPRGVDDTYVWGDARQELARRQPDLRIVNLETAVTTSETPWPGKGVHYRMHPANVSCLRALPADCCVLANNHVMDWGEAGLLETLEVLHAAGLQTAGAGRNLDEATAPAVFRIADDRRVLVFAFAFENSGVPAAWRASAQAPGLGVLRDFASTSVKAVARAVDEHRCAGDRVVISLHWGPNWGFGVDPAERHFAHELVRVAGADIVHGHSSHHVRAIEVHRGRLILYGCGDLLNDYEGIPGHEVYRGDLALMYFAALDDSTGALRELVLVPTCTRRFRINYAAPDQADWLYTTLNREGRSLGTRVERNADGTLSLRW